MSTKKLLKREVKQTLLQGKLHHLQSSSCQMMSPKRSQLKSKNKKRSQLKSKNKKRSQLKSKNKEVIQMTTQILRTLTRRMEMLMINQRQRSGMWSFVTMMEGMHAFCPS
jgi:5-methylcytosine-specific restriction endonuclease McrA